MKLHDIAVAAAVVSFASVAVAAGNDGSTSSSTPSSGQSYSSGQSQSAQSPSSSSSSSMSSQQNGQSSSAAQGQDQQTVRGVQQALKQKGFDVGAVDGQMGPETQGALRDFQQSKGLPQSGNLDQQTLSALGVSGQGSANENSSMQSQESQASGAQGSMSRSIAPSGSNDTNEGVAQNRDRMQNGGATNGTETTPASPK